MHIHLNTEETLTQMPCRNISLNSFICPKHINERCQFHKFIRSSSITFSREKQKFEITV